MRLGTLIGTIAAAATAATLFAGTASADRVCRKVCDEGFCRTRCVERGPHMYMYDRHHDRDYYYHRKPGFDVEIGR